MIYAYRKDPIFVMGETEQNERVVRISYHQNSHYNSVIPKEGAADKAWILSDTLGSLEDATFVGLEDRGRVVSGFDGSS